MELQAINSCKLLGADQECNQVRYARKNNIPFLTKNFGHGSPSTLEKFQGGIQINVGNLNSIQINSKTNVAVMGAGVYTEEVIQALYAAGKQSR